MTNLESQRNYERVEGDEGQSKVNSQKNPNELVDSNLSSHCCEMTALTTAPLCVIG